VRTEEFVGLLDAPQADERIGVEVLPRPEPRFVGGVAMREAPNGVQRVQHLDRPPAGFTDPGPRHAEGQHRSLVADVPRRVVLRHGPDVILCRSPVAAGGRHQHGDPDHRGLQEPEVGLQVDRHRPLGVQHRLVPGAGQPFGPGKIGKTERRGIEDPEPGGRHRRGFQILSGSIDLVIDQVQDAARDRGFTHSCAISPGISWAGAAASAASSLCPA